MTGHRMTAADIAAWHAESRERVRAIVARFAVGDRIRELERMEVEYNGDVPEQCPVESDRRGRIVNIEERPSAGSTGTGLTITVEWDRGPPPLTERVDYWNIEHVCIVDSLGKLAAE